MSNSIIHTTKRDILAVMAADMGNYGLAAEIEAGCAIDDEGWCLTEHGDFDTEEGALERNVSCPAYRRHLTA